MNFDFTMLQRRSSKGDRRLGRNSAKPKAADASAEGSGLGWGESAKRGVIGPLAKLPNPCHFNDNSDQEDLCG